MFGGLSLRLTSALIVAAAVLLAGCGGSSSSSSASRGKTTAAAAPRYQAPSQADPPKPAADFSLKAGRFIGARRAA